MSTDERLAVLLSSMEGDMLATFIAVISGINSDVLISQLIDAIEAGDFEKVFQSLGIMPGKLQPLVDTIQKMLDHAADFTVKTYPRHVTIGDTKVAFKANMRNERAEQWLREKSSKMITSITDEVRTSVRDTVTLGMEQGRNPRHVALDIVGRVNRTTGVREGGIVGLTASQSSWVNSARRRLSNITTDPEAYNRYMTMGLRNKKFDQIVERAKLTGKPLTVSEIDNLVTAYANNTLKYRGETIARQEAMEAFNKAEHESAKQVIEVGAAKEKHIKRTWDDVGDKRTRHSHREMDGQTVGIDEPFVTPTGEKLMYPTDGSLGASTKEIIGCRCRVRVVIDWIGVGVDENKS